MVVRVDIGDIPVDVVLKDIRNIHLSVYPPTGRVRISAPSHMNIDTIRVYAISRLGWIKKQQGKLRQQERETPREYLNRESHYLWGKRYLLKIIERDAPFAVAMQHSTILLYVRPETCHEKKEELIDEWYRKQLKLAVPELIALWEKRIGVQVSEFGVRKMKTKWGTCNPQAQRIWINLELAKKPKECLEYIVVHEMVHLLERHHNERFTALMDNFMPKWRSLRDDLNRLPVRHEEWDY
ncbi:M48 family metallopeptidase [Chlorobium sp. KB01]|uniref:M48 family metallopeptidase n=1 Tax=Chlorobium sp. KB01 TaxID=1917528 RepID=UPI0009755976|nr:SprT family zinc-dependent metalloprotease [Chlorobium sp. KB01]